LVREPKAGVAVRKARLNASGGAELFARMKAA